MQDSRYRVELSELLELIRSGRAQEDLSGAGGPGLAVTVLDAAPAGEDAEGLQARAAGIPAVLVGVLTDLVGPARQLAPIFDLMLADPNARDLPIGAVGVEDVDATLAELAGAITQWPIAAIAATLLLRRSPGRTVDEDLAAESAVYSTLQAGPEFAAWLGARPARRRSPPDLPAVVASRVGAMLRITLSTPEIHNAYTSRTRDELVQALTIADVDRTVESVVIEGAGPSFCSGGYLDEFGTLPDPATAHLVRLTRSAARLMARLAARTEVRIHGAAIGAGIELPAFAHRVVADPDTRIVLPELSFGLIPGAGGTASLPRRIGRQRTLYMALTRAPIDAVTALEWGLVDEIRAKGDW